MIVGVGDINVARGIHGKPERPADLSLRRESAIALVADITSAGKGGDNAVRRDFPDASVLTDIDATERIRGH